MADYLIRVSTVPIMPPRLAGIRLKEWDANHSNIGNPDPVFSPGQIFVRYITSFMCAVDAIAIIPSFIFEFTSIVDSSFTVIRILRVVRIIKIAKRSRLAKNMEAFRITFRHSASALAVLVFFTAIGLVIFASIIFIIEQGSFTVNSEYPEGAYLRPSATASGKELSPFRSIAISIYWACVTITTLGYGDMYPTTTLGRFFTIIWMFCGVLLIALPVSVLGSNFSSALAEIDARRKQEGNLGKWSVLRDVVAKKIPGKLFRRRSIGGGIDDVDGSNNTCVDSGDDQYRRSVSAEYNRDISRMHDVHSPEHVDYCDSGRYISSTSKEITLMPRKYTGSKFSIVESSERSDTTFNALHYSDEREISAPCLFAVKQYRSVSTQTSASVSPIESSHYWDSNSLSSPTYDSIDRAKTLATAAKFDTGGSKRMRELSSQIRELLTAYEAEQLQFQKTGSDGWW
eukprot:CAMPEP_0185034002 /NCGR_PEP_ID=MMETSP1103-20130426/23475_1 /TAXON_ID=36769 /ORGANISM="Paraphysomonas bandaiensis, Strain Caron Lab Isolate" /LENGTH=456 /DNA_ID=CAMNT_0027570479 /DNA_START=358 /DNA_END=1728 /DNA_ORIENTATION=-